jgi:hypothetical protein
VTSAHPRGGRWDKFRRLVFATHGTVCILCLHGGARTVDHLVSVTERPDLTWALGNCRPIHSAPYNRCPVCVAMGLSGNCNGIKGGYSLERARRKFEGLMAARKPAAQVPEKAPDAISGRPW